MTCVRHLEIDTLFDSNVIGALILGVVEGVTEFIPVSSTGHLIIARDFLGYPVERFDVLVFVIQLAAILAICLLYARRLIGVVVDLPSRPEARRFVLAVGIAFVPSVVLGLMLEKFMKEHLFTPWVVATALVVGGVVILAVERIAHRPRFHDTAEVPPTTAFGIGLCQTLAMIPGVSRSGATIMGALLLGLDRKAAAEFSFFLAIPTMLGAGVLDLYKGWRLIDGSLAVDIAVASVASFVTALVVVRAFVAYIARHDFTPFGWYRIVAGVLMLGLLAAGYV